MPALILYLMDRYQGKNTIQSTTIPKNKIIGPTVVIDDLYFLNCIFDESIAAQSAVPNTIINVRLKPISVEMVMHAAANPIVNSIAIHVFIVLRCW